MLYAPSTPALCLSRFVALFPSSPSLHRSALLPPAPFNCESVPLAGGGFVFAIQLVRQRRPLDDPSLAGRVLSIDAVFSVSR